MINIIVSGNHLPKWPCNCFQQREILYQAVAGWQKQLSREGGKWIKLTLGAPSHICACGYRHATISLNSYHKHNITSAQALYHTATLNGLRKPLCNTLIHVRAMLGLIAQLCLGIRSAVHNVLIFAVVDSKAKSRGVNVCACVLSGLGTQRNLGSHTWHTFLLQQETLRPNARMFRGALRFSNWAFLSDLCLGAERRRWVLGGGTIKWGHNCFLPPFLHSLCTHMYPSPSLHPHLFLWSPA